MKDLFSYAEVGERYDDYALAWDKIPSASFQKLNYFNAAALQKSSEARLAKNKDYQLLLESSEWREKLNKERSIPLNQAKFTELTKQRKAQIEKFKPLDKIDIGVQFTVYPKDVEREKKDEAFKKKTENWMKSMKKDVYLQEAINVISEMKQPV
jgi:carboxyl-terminal processing protease